MPGEARDDGHGGRLCHAPPTRTGQFCTGWAVHGQSTCRLHGGGSGEANRRRGSASSPSLTLAIGALAWVLANGRDADRLRDANPAPTGGGTAR